MSLIFLWPENCKIRFCNTAIESAVADKDIRTLKQIQAKSQQAGLDQTKTAHTHIHTIFFLNIHAPIFIHTNLIYIYIIYVYGRVVYTYKNVQQMLLRTDAVIHPHT